MGALTINEGVSGDALRTSHSRGEEEHRDERARESHNQRHGGPGDVVRDLRPDLLWCWH